MLRSPATTLTTNILTFWPDRMLTGLLFAIFFESLNFFNQKPKDFAIKKKWSESKFFSNRIYMWQRPSGGLTCQPATTATPGNITGEALAEKKTFLYFFQPFRLLLYCRNYNKTISYLIKTLSNTIFSKTLHFLIWVTMYIFLSLIHILVYNIKN